jgi:hypothetical protein
LNVLEFANSPGKKKRERFLNAAFSPDQRKKMPPDETGGNKGRSRRGHPRRSLLVYSEKS